MPYSNFHSHTSFCDGHASPEDYIKEAFRQKIFAYGFSSHAPLPFPCDWTIKKNKIENYINEIKELKLQYGNNIHIACGLEVDFIPGISSPNSPEITSLELDYTIGSIHFVDSFKDGKNWQIDNTPDIFHTGLVHIFNNNIQKAVTRYFELTRQMLHDSPPDILGHLDKIKMHNTKNKLFDEQENWYREEIIRTLNLIKEKNVIVEINTRGFYKRNENLSPGIWILKIIRDMEIPIIVISDAHEPHEISLGMEYTYNILKNLKFNTVSSFFNKSWQSFQFDTQGIKINN